MRFVQTLALTLGTVLAAVLAMHLAAAAISPEFFRDYLMPFAEGPDLALRNRWTLAAYLAWAMSWRPGLLGGVLAYTFSTLGKTPPLPMRRVAATIATSTLLVLAWRGWSALSASRRGVSGLSIAGDLMQVPRRPAIVVAVLVLLALYIGRRFTSPRPPAPPGSPAAPPAPET
jgi:hypothetical protein